MVEAVVHHQVCHDLTLHHHDHIRGDTQVVDMDIPGLMLSLLPVLVLSTGKWYHHFKKLCDMICAYLVFSRVCICNAYDHILWYLSRIWLMIMQILGTVEYICNANLSVLIYIFHDSPFYSPFSTPYYGGPGVVAVNRGPSLFSLIFFAGFALFVASALSNIGSSATDTLLVQLEVIKVYSDPVYRRVKSVWHWRFQTETVPTPSYLL